MERFDFSKGHIFIQNGNWSIFMNGAGNCGRSKYKETAIKEILNHWKLTEDLKSELSKILKIEIKTEIKIGEQLQLF